MKNFASAVVWEESRTEGNDIENNQNEMRIEGYWNCRNKRK
jgi:hypothetical protein